MMNLPTKIIIKQEESKIKVDDRIRCTVEEFIYPIRVMLNVYNHSAVIRIENTMDCDKELAKSKANIAVARLVDMEVIDN